MPNRENIDAPTLIVGAGRTASSYVVALLQHAVGNFQEIIENDVYKVLYECCATSWWSKDWHWIVKEPSEVERRIKAAIHSALLDLFPSSMPRWAMKMIWDGHDANVVDSLFPRAQYLHLVRDPRANIPSIVERIGWSRQAAEQRYVTSNENGLAFERFSGRYLRVRQEDFDSDRTGTWKRVCEFLGAPFNPTPNWGAPVNRSQSQHGVDGFTRSEDRLVWKDLTKEVRTMAQRLGYTT